MQIVRFMRGAMSEAGVITFLKLIVSRPKSNVLAFFNHANGKVHAECQADHKTDTFLATFKRHVSTCPANEPAEDWERLFTVLQSQEATVRNSILNEDGPRKKQNAENALNALFSTLEDYFRQNMRVAA